MTTTTPRENTDWRRYPVETWRILAALSFIVLIVVLMSVAVGKWMDLNARRIYEEGLERFRVAIGQNVSNGPNSSQVSVIETAANRNRKEVNDELNRLTWSIAAGMMLLALTGIIAGYWLVKQFSIPLSRINKNLGGEGDDASQSTSLLSIEHRVKALSDLAHQSESELRQRQKELVHAQRLATLGQMAAGLAHEIRNPLAAVKMRLYALRHCLPADNDIHEDIDVIGAETERLSHLVTAMLDFARPAPSSNKLITLGEVLDPIQQLLEPRFNQQKIQIVIEPSCVSYQIFADGDQIRQVLLNLCLNSMEAMSAGGELSITAEPLPQPSNQLVVHVADTGSGISQEMLENLFVPFISGRPQGLGLGLVISARLMAQQGGTLRLAKTSPQGTLFDVIIPMAGKVLTPQPTQEGA